MPESPEHVRIKDLISEKLKAWFGCSIKEYPSSGHELDVFAVTTNGISIYVEIIWSASQVHFLKDLSSVEQSDANVKIVVANPEILGNEEYVRQFDKAVANQRRQGFKIYGDMVDGSIIIGQDSYLNKSFRKIVKSLILEIEKEQKTIAAADIQRFIPLDEKEVDDLFKEYARSIIDQYTKFSTVEPALPIAIEQLSKFDFKKHYINVFLQDLENRSVASSDGLISNWLEHPDRNGLFIIGDFGTGKSTLCAHLAYQMACKFLKNEVSRVPLVVSLRKVGNISKESMAKELEKVIKLKWEQITQLSKFGKLLFILDGFDEIPRRTDWDKTIADFNDIVALFCVGKSKVIITCRTHFFKKDSEIWGEDTELMKSLRATKNFKIISTIPFNKEQILEYIAKRTDDSQRVWDQIENTYNLQDLCKRPLLADMIISTLPKLILMGGEIDAITLYEKYTEEWINREDWRSQLKPSTKEELMERLAYYLHCQEVNFISHEDLQGIIEKEFHVKKGSDVSDYYDYDIRTCSFFRRDSEGNYSFMHKSFLEFFTAKKVSRSINRGDALELAKKLLSDEIVLFAAKLINPNRKNTLFDAIYHTRGKSLEDFGVLGGNALKLLFKMGERKFEKIDFSSCAIQNVYLHNCEFCECRFEKSKLKQISFDLSSIARCNLSESCLDSCSFGETRIVSSNFAKSKFINVTFGASEISSDCQLDLTEFNECSFHDFSFKGVEIKGAFFNGGKSKYRFLERGINFVNCKIESGKFKNFSLPLSLFQEVDVYNTSFVNSDFEGTCFYRCSFSESSFNAGSLSFVTLFDVKCRKTTFADSRFYNTYLEQDSMGDATFDHCHLRMIDHPYHRMPSHKRAIVEFDINLPAFCALNRAVESFSLSDEFEDSVIELYQKSWSAAKGTGRMTAIAACFYIRSKETNRPRTMKEVAKAFNESEKGIFRTYSKLFTGGYSEPNLVTSEDWLEIFSKELGIRRETELLAQEILKMATRKRLTSGRGKVTNAAACLYLACKENNERMTLKSVATKANLSTVAIRNAFQSIAGGLG